MKHLTSENIRGFFLVVLFISIPFSIAGDDFAIIGLYLVTIYRIATRQDRLAYKPVMFGMGLLLFGAVISALFSGDVIRSLSYFRNFWRLGLPFLVLLAFRNRSSDRYIRILAVVTSLIAVYGVAQFFTGVDVLRSAERQAEYYAWMGEWHAVGVFSHHLTFGGVFLVLFAMFLPGAFSREIGRRERLLFFFAGVSGMAAATATMGRSIWLGIIAAVGVMMLVFLGRKLSLSIILIVAVLIGGFYFSKGTGLEKALKKTYIGNRALMFSVKYNQDRLLMWKAAIRAIQHNPVLGLGPNRRNLLQSHYDAVSRKYHHEFFHKAHVGVHNLYLQNWVDFGFFGMAGYLIWWGTLLFQIAASLRAGSKTGKLNTRLLGYLAGLSGIMVAGLFENNFRDGEVQTAVLLVMGLSLVMLERKDREMTTAEKMTETTELNNTVR